MFLILGHWISILMLPSQFFLLNSSLLPSTMMSLRALFPLTMHQFFFQMDGQSFLLV